MILEMPAVETTTLPVNTKRYVEEAYREVNAEDRVGILPQNERSLGTVPVTIDHGEVPYAGVTEIHPHYKTAKRVGINSRVHPRYVKRVAKHEFRHVQSEGLLKYADIPQWAVTLIMESYAEYKPHKIRGLEHEVHEIRKTTPYQDAIKFGEHVDELYVSETGKAGYRAFIEDIQTKGSMKAALKRLGQCQKDAKAYAKAA